MISYYLNVCTVFVRIACEHIISVVSLHEISAQRDNFSRSLFRKWQFRLNLEKLTWLEEVIKSCKHVVFK